MDKPISLSVKQFLIRKMAVDLMVSEKTIEAVVNHQFNSMLDAMKTADIIDLSGFGRFLFNSTKAVRIMQKYTANQKLYKELLSGDISEQKRKNLEGKLNTANVGIKALKPRMNED